MIARGIVRDQQNPFKVPPSFDNWAPYMGRHTRAGPKMYNTEYLKVTQQGTDKIEPVPEELINRLLHEEKLDTIKRFCRIVGLSQKGSLLDLLCRLRNHSMTRSSFDHAYSALHGHSGGWVSSTCPHNITYAVKFLLRSESPRDYCDILRSMKHVPTVNIADIAHSLAKMADKVIQPDFFRPNLGRLAEPTQEYVTAALGRRLEVSMPFLSDDRPVRCSSNDHPITGNQERYMLFDWFHETNISEPVESLRRSSLVRELKGMVNTQAAEQIHRDKVKDIYFQNQMSPSNHVFMFRLLTHLKNYLGNRGVLLRTQKHIQDITENSIGQLISASGQSSTSVLSGVRTVRVKPPRRMAPVLRQGGVATNEGAVATNEGAVATNEGVVTTNERVVTINNGAVTTNKGAVTTNEGPTPKNNTSTTGQRVQSVGTDLLYMYKVVGDGNCFFRSVGLALQEYGEDEHSSLRQHAWEWCNHNKSRLDITEQELEDIWTLGHPVGDHAATALANVLDLQINVWYDTKTDRECRVFTV